MTSYAAPVLLLFAQICAIYGDVAKSSLTFAIDDTGSMTDEIRQVKEETNAVFDTVLRSNSSQIENFILVTFNDPDVKLRAITKDSRVFKRALANIIVDGGGDCPEYAMKGIELALEKSLPRSYVYVFTDASAKDHRDYGKIQSLAQKKQIQIVFLLTGNCGAESAEDYRVYYKVAEATSGQVFHMEKNDVRDVLEYVKETIKNRGEVLVSKKLPPGYHKKLTFPVDSDTGDVLISATGDKPRIEDVTGPDGSKPKLIPVIEKDRIAVVKVKDAKVGDHEVDVGSRSETHAVITAKTTIHFEPGFSPVKPSSMKAVATRPPPDGNSFLAIQLEGEGAILDTAKILDLHDNVIMEQPLELVDEKDKFYVTLSFDAPYTTFKIAVTGHDVKTGSKIIRTSPTPIKRQDPSTEKTENVAPLVTIDGETDLKVEYNAPLQLKCKVHGYPKPEITWEEKETGTILPSTVSVIEVPYDYYGILDILKVNKTSTYECKARNFMGEQKKTVHVENNIYFNVIETPTNLRLNYNTDGRLVCKVDSKPPNTVTWYKNGKPFTVDTNVEFSADNTILTVKHMQPELKGHYMCEVKNDFNRKVFHSYLEIYGTEPPVIKKDTAIINVEKGADAELPCRIVKGIPRPTVRWYFQRKGTEKFRPIYDRSETLRFRNVGVYRFGSYKCVATNAYGTDVFVMELFVEYPPKITNLMTNIKVKDGDKVELPCEADGVPAPEVTWYFNGTRVDSTNTTRIAADNTFKFRATVADIGIYTCEARNKLGVDKKSVQVDVYVPIYIEVPKETTIQTMVGKSVNLPCRADGYPRPDIKWMFHSIDPRVAPKEIKPPIVDYVYIKNAQLDQRGFYTCVASNAAGESANITYEVKIFAPPIIENVYTDKKFRVVDGDLSLRIQCKATGSPEPSIMWMKDGKNIALGSEWYDMDADGTLIIKNINAEAKGTYVCLAENVIGQDSEMYDVEVDDYPKHGPTTTILTRTGVPLDVKCDIPHKKTDLLRWYKHGKIIAYGELKIPDVTLTDEGLYTCRVSDFFKSHTAHTDVKIGFAPTFISDEETNIEFVYKDPAFLQCDVVGVPDPKVTWTHNGKTIPRESDTILAFEMSFKDLGVYVCEASNKFGSIHRTFNITTTDCVLDLKNDFPTNQPLMVSSASDWTTFKTADGYMTMPQGQYFYLQCPTGFADAPLSKELMAFCEKENKMKINGRIYDFSEIKCRNEAKPEVSKTGVRCLSDDTEYLAVGYKVFETFLKAYDVCFDKERNVTLFAKHKVHPEHTDIWRELEWGTNDLPLDFDGLYRCSNQIEDITRSLGKRLTTGYSCCFDKRQLVDSRSLLPSIPPSASFTYLNAVPHWSTCGTKNWNDVEQKVRDLAKGAGREMTVATGSASRPGSSDIILHDRRGGSQPVGEYLWKVVQDPATSSSLAIVQVNIPDLTSEEAIKHELCRDVCNLIDWLPGSNWRNVKDGFTYCCTISEFERVFNYKGVFSHGMNKLLFDASTLPEYYLTT